MGHRVEETALCTPDEMNARLSEMLDWIKRLHFDDRLEGLVILAVEKQEDGTLGSVRSMLDFANHKQHVETLRLWCDRAESLDALSTCKTRGSA